MKFLAIDNRGLEVRFIALSWEKAEVIARRRGLEQLSEIVSVQPDPRQYYIGVVK